MAKYPKVEPYVALKQGVGMEYEEEAELDCGCVIRDHEDGVSIEFYFCTLHDAAQQLLDALEAQHLALDSLFAKLASSDRSFFPSESGMPWEAMQQGLGAIAKAKGGT